jgi:hypothetical protein
MDLFIKNKIMEKKKPSVKDYFVRIAMENWVVEEPLGFIWPRKYQRSSTQVNIFLFFSQYFYLCPVFKKPTNPQRTQMIQEMPIGGYINYGINSSIIDAF